jgi:hypothetical protein
MASNFDLPDGPDAASNTLPNPPYPPSSSAAFSYHPDLPPTSLSDTLPIPPSSLLPSLSASAFPPSTSSPSARPAGLPYAPIRSNSTSVQLGVVVDDPHPGFPTVNAFEAEKEAYLSSLDQKKKRAKALGTLSFLFFSRRILIPPSCSRFRALRLRPLDSPLPARHDSPLRSRPILGACNFHPRSQRGRTQLRLRRRQSPHLPLRLETRRSA